MNLGPKSTAALAAIGITSLAQLRRAGAVTSYLRLKQQTRGVSLNMLYALVGAIEGIDWRSIKRERKLALLAELDGHAQTPARRSAPRDELLALRNIGPAMRRDLERLGIRTVKQLARCNADRLYARLQDVTGTRQDPCVCDTFAAAIHQARTGEALPWWRFTVERKQRERSATVGRKRAAKK